MDIEFDPTKSEVNAQQRGLPFEAVYEFEFDSAMFAEDLRKDYGKMRIQALGLIRGRVHVLVFTEALTGIRVISLRKANKREVKRYEDAKES